LKEESSLKGGGRMKNREQSISDILKLLKGYLPRLPSKTYWQEIAWEDPKDDLKVVFGLKKIVFLWRKEIRLVQLGISSSSRDLSLVSSLVLDRDFDSSISKWLSKNLPPSMIKEIEKLVKREPEIKKLE
jgi:hypothetical protein